MLRKGSGFVFSRNYLKRLLSTQTQSNPLLDRLNSKKPKICIVGSGPAGFYAAQYITSRVKSAQIDIYERLPVPFGLVRFGVAPDHANLKKCMNSFIKTAELPNVNYYGNVTLGTDVRVKELCHAYHIVLLAYGVDDSKKFDVPGSDLGNIFQAKDFVGWYNGHPSNVNLKIDLSGPRATIFGHGNVAIDIARILLSPLDKLKTTDITQHSLDALAHSKVKEVHLIGRRGPLQVNFTIKELRELFNLEQTRVEWNATDMEGVAEVVPQLVRPRKRLTELMVETFQKCNKNPTSDANKILKPIFHRSPQGFMSTSHKVNSVKLVVNELQGDDLLNKVARPTDKFETLETDLVISSLGYKSIQADPDIKFDDKRGVVVTQSGSGGKIDSGLYATGWLASGPSGVLLNTMQNAFGVADVILEDLGGPDGGCLDENKAGSREIVEILEGRNVQVVTWDDWLKIDRYEVDMGSRVNKPREKVVDVAKMLEIAAS